MLGDDWGAGFFWGAFLLVSESVSNTSELT